MAMKHSRQRDAIWSFIRDRKDHPTADVVYSGVREEFPNISLATVYRNLMLLKKVGKLQTIDVGDGLVHFDPNIMPHSHFICSKCGKVIDAEYTDPVQIQASAKAKFPGRIDGCSVFFYGLCADCLRQEMSGNSASATECNENLAS